MNMLPHANMPPEAIKTILMTAHEHGIQTNFDAQLDALGNLSTAGSHNSVTGARPSASWVEGQTTVNGVSTFNTLSASGAHDAIILSGADGPDAIVGSSSTASAETVVDLTKNGDHRAIVGELSGDREGRAYQDFLRSIGVTDPSDQRSIMLEAGAAMRDDAVRVNGEAAAGMNGGKWYLLTTRNGNVPSIAKEYLRQQVAINSRYAA
jgi:hypothetical protein